MNGADIETPAGSPSRDISNAVNELLGASGRDKADSSVTGIAAEKDATFTAGRCPEWIVPAQARGEPRPAPWTADATCAHTGMLRVYTAERVTAAEVTGEALAGIRYSHKDNIGVSGFPITAGNPSLDDRRSAVTSPLLSAVESAGGTVVGANHMAEFAMSPTGHNQWLGDGVNPRHAEYMSGGSSSGSAIAVARGACDVSFGTDTGGSVRLPAAFCGLRGYKPTNGLFSSIGLLPLSETLDTIGLIARQYEQLQATAAVLFDDEDVVAPELRDLLRQRHAEAGETVAHLSVDQVARVSDTPVARGYERALHALGRGAAPGFELDFSDLERNAVIIVSTEAARNVGRVVHWDWNLLGDQVLSRVIRGTTVPAIEYADAVHERSAAVQAFLDEGFAASRFLVMPTAPILAPRISSVEDQASASVRRDYMRTSAFTRFTNYLGLPAVTLPLPGKDTPAPALQVLGRPFDDLALLDFAKTVDELAGN